jgi:hypothetical protein
MVVRAQRGERLGALIGDNRFDLYTLVRLAKARGLDPELLLGRIELSRAFTCHHLHRRACTLDPALVRKWQALYVLGLLDTFYDESVKYHEAARLLGETLARLKQIAAMGLPIRVTLSPPRHRGRESLVRVVQRAVDAYWEFSPEPRYSQSSQLALPVVSIREGQSGECPKWDIPYPPPLS